MSRHDEPPQIRLFPYHNPLKSDYWDMFYKQITQEPGIYRMYDEQKELLYVGKAKNLRKRLQSYRYVHPDTSSSKTVRLIHKIHFIEIQKTENEAEALKLENKWLREIKPPFNSANTRHEKYLFIGVDFDSNQQKWTLRWTMRQETIKSPLTLGAFKGIGPSYRFLMAVQRGLWMISDSENQSISLNLPWLMQRKKPAQKIELPKMEEDFVNELFFLFLTGKSDEWVDWLEIRLSEICESNFNRRYAMRVIEDGRHFYTRYLRRQHLLVSTLKWQEKSIPQDKIDDLLVDFAFGTEPILED